MNSVRKSFRSILTMLLLAVFVFPLLVGRARAADKSGVTLTPPFQEITILQNQASVGSSFSLSNNNAEPATFDLSAIDMGALDDTGGVVFSGLSADYQQKYGLAKWLQLSVSSVTVPGKSTQAVNFSVINAPDMTPGGHYGAVIVKPEGQNQSAQNQISLQPQTATLLFVRKIGGEKYDLNLEGQTTKTYAWRLPTTINLTFRNDGNVHVVPRGFVVLNDPSGQEIARGIINPESSIILPEHTRIYATQLVFTKKVRRPGTYIAVVSYRYDGSQTFKQSQLKLRFINFTLFGIILVLVVALGGLAWTYVSGNSLIFQRIKAKSKRKPDKPAARHTFMSVRRLDRNVKTPKARKK